VRSITNNNDGEDNRNDISISYEFLTNNSIYIVYDYYFIRNKNLSVIRKVILF
jgi:hypothetical protein